MGTIISAETKNVIALRSSIPPAIPIVPETVLVKKLANGKIIKSKKTSTKKQFIYFPEKCDLNLNYFVTRKYFFPRFQKFHAKK